MADTNTTETSEIAACRCGNEYLAIRTDLYKDKREFVYCDCCGALADRKTWQLASQPVTQSVEPVAWQFRLRPEGSAEKWSEWRECVQSIAIHFDVRTPISGWEYEVRALYAAPQPSVSQEAGK